MSRALVAWTVCLMRRFARAEPTRPGARVSVTLASISLVDLPAMPSFSGNALSTGHLDDHDKDVLRWIAISTSSLSIMGTSFVILTFLALRRITPPREDQSPEENLVRKY